MSVDHNMMSFIHKVHGKPRLHVSVNLLFGAWLPCCATLPSSPSCAPASNTASHDNHEKVNSWVSFTFYGYGAPLSGFGHRSSAIIDNFSNFSFNMLVTNWWLSPAKYFFHSPWRPKWSQLRALHSRRSIRNARRIPVHVCRKKNGHFKIRMKSPHTIHLKKRQLDWLFIVVLV